MYSSLAEWLSQSLLLSRGFGWLYLAVVMMLFWMPLLRQLWRLLSGFWRLTTLLRTVRNEGTASTANGNLAIAVHVAGREPRPGKHDRLWRDVREFSPGDIHWVTNGPRLHEAGNGVAELVGGDDCR